MFKKKRFFWVPILGLFRNGLFRSVIVFESFGVYMDMDVNFKFFFIKANFLTKEQLDELRVGFSLFDTGYLKFKISDFYAFIRIFRLILLIKIMMVT